MLSRLRHRCALAHVVLVFASSAIAANQTDSLSPVHVGSSQPYGISVRTYDFGAAERPTLHSFAAGTYDGKWIMLAGRTNGLHGFGQTGQQNFPPQYQNKEVWVIDPMTKQSWHRSLANDTTLTPLQLAALSSTNTGFAQVGNRLYVAGGYGQGPTSSFQTYDVLSSIDLPGITQWAMSGTGSAASSIRSIEDENFRVTGGAMYAMNGRMHMVFGQNFIGGYPNGTGVYTKQVRSFAIVDDGINLGTANFSATAPDEAHRRRDLNVFPTVHRNPDGTPGRGLEALSGVFTPTNGAWTVPVYIDQNVNTFMADPASPDTFKQAMNNYQSARLGMYSERDGSMHEVLFGGITLSYYDFASQAFVQDNNMPFTSQVTQVNIDAAGQHTQDLLGEFPALLDQSGNRMRFGADAEFFLADGIPTYDNGVIRLDELTGPTVLGYVYGGIFANAPHTQGVSGAVSGASNEIFEVVYTPVPEPAVGFILVGLAGRVLVRRRNRISQLSQLPQAPAESDATNGYAPCSSASHC
jgi:hypothetical protein